MRERDTQRETNTNTEEVEIFCSLCLSLCVCVCVCLSVSLSLLKTEASGSEDYWCYFVVVPCPKVVELREDARVWHMVLHTCAFVFCCCCCCFVWPSYPKKKLWSKHYSTWNTSLFLPVDFVWRDKRRCTWLFGVCMVVLPFFVSSYLRSCSVKFGLFGQKFENSFHLCFFSPATKLLCVGFKGI